MSSGESRLNKLYPALSARERAVLVLKAMKEDGEEDRRVRQTMPPAQGHPAGGRALLLRSLPGHVRGAGGGGTAGLPQGPHARRRGLSAGRQLNSERAGSFGPAFSLTSRPISRGIGW